MSAVSPHGDEEQEERRKEGEVKNESMEDNFRRVFGESVEDVIARESEETAGEEKVRVRARDAKPVPSSREVEEHNLDHAVFRSWCPHCVKGSGGVRTQEKRKRKGRRADHRD